MKKLKVDGISDQEGILYAVTSSSDNVLHNLEMVYATENIAALLAAVEEQPAVSFYKIDRFHQFIFILEYSEKTFFVMKWVDFRNKASLLIEQYKQLTQRNWTAADIDRVMDLAGHIETGSSMPVELVVRHEL